MGPRVLGRSETPQNHSQHDGEMCPVAVAEVPKSAMTPPAMDSHAETTILSTLPGDLDSSITIGYRAPGGHWSGSESVGSGIAVAGAGAGQGPRGHGSGGGSSDERPEHEWLKALIAGNPTLLGDGLTRKTVEYRFQSLDKVDLRLETRDGSPVTVEVEAAIRTGSYVGIWQAVKYQHLAAMDYGLECKAVRTIVVAPPGFPHSSYRPGPSNNVNQRRTRTVEQGAIAAVRLAMLPLRTGQRAAISMRMGSVVAMGEAAFNKAKGCGWTRRDNRPTLASSPSAC